MAESADVRALLADQSTDDLVLMLARRDEREWRPEAFEAARAVLAERGVDVAAVVEAKRASLPGPLPPDELEVIATFNTVPDSTPLQSVLEGAGLDVYLIDDSTLTVDPALLYVVNGVKVGVPRTQAAEARAFVEAMERGELALPKDVPAECPACGSGAVVRAGATARGDVQPDDYVCNDCGARM